MRTQKSWLVTLISVMVFLVAACSGASNQPSTTTRSAGTNNSNPSTSLSQVNMLLVGTLKLEDTDQAITAEEATQLLPLWQAYLSLSTSQTAAEAEVDALLNQIQNTMTSEQVTAIKAMNLASKDMMDLMQSMGGGMGPQGTPNPQSTPGINTSGGGFPSGNPPSGFAGSPPSGTNGGPSGNFPAGGAMPGVGGNVIAGGGDAGSAAGLGGGPMAQGTQDPSMQATAQARFSTQANQVNTMLLHVLITKLEDKASN